jgi:Leucine-rich repeat (LRR) protein
MCLVTGSAGLECLTALRTLNLSGNNIQDTAPIAALLHLDYLALTDNDIEDISPLNQLPFLTTLVVSANAITDLSPLLTDPAITPNDTIDIRSNPFDCAQQAAAIEELVSMGVDVVHDCGEG